MTQIDAFTGNRWRDLRASPQIMRMRYIRLSSALLLLACADGEPTAPPTPVATSITLSATSLSFSSLGQAQQLTATVKDQNGATMSGATVTWASATTGVATVSSAGLVTAVSNGTASILAASGSVNGTATVTVAQVVSTLEVSPSTSTFASLGDTLTLSATAKDSGGSAISDATVTWATSDALIATVTSDGLVTAVAVGIVDITATSGSATGTAEIEIMNVTVTDASAELDDVIEAYAFTGGLLTDELSGTGSYWNTGQYRLGRFTEDNSEEFWEQTHEAIRVAGEAWTRLQTVLGSEASNDVGSARLFYLMGTAHQRLGENFCEVMYDNGTVQPRTAAFDSAVVAFNQAKAIGGAANAQMYVDAGWGGLAQAYVGLGDWAGAVAAAGNVPTNFVIEAIYDQATNSNQVYDESWGRAEVGVWATPVQRQFNPTVDSLWKATGDPRIPYTVCGQWNDTNRPPDLSLGITATGACTGQGSGAVYGLGEGGQTAHYRQDKYTEPGSNIPTITGTEMRLIEAEFAVRTNDAATFIAKVNEVRAHYGADPLSFGDEGAANSGTGSLNWDNCLTWAANCDVHHVSGMWSILDRERHMTLWLEGRRFWDLHRWDHPFLIYGTLVGPGEPRRASCMPVPA